MPERIIELDPARPMWERFFTVAPLVLVGTVEPEGAHDLAPKHMAMPLGWDAWFCFVCSPRHATQRNAVATGAFTVSFPRPGQVVQLGQAAAMRDAEGVKHALAALPVRPARKVEGVLVDGCALWLECALDRVIDGFGANSLVIGRVVAAEAVEAALRDADRDDADLLGEEPALAYLAPGRFARVAETRSFPFPAAYRR